MSSLQCTCTPFHSLVQLPDRSLASPVLAGRALIAAHHPASYKHSCGPLLRSHHPKGTAKSEVGRRLSQLIQGSYFERLLTRFSVPEELFGPLSMRALEEDKYVRQTRGYLPDAQVRGLHDEMGVARPPGSCACRQREYIQLYNKLVERGAVCDGGRGVARRWMGTAG